MRSTTAFMSEDYLIENGTAHELYKAAKSLPIFDYHCHLSPREICEDRVFHNLAELWLESDHYKWRLMRAAGLPEELVTGGAPGRDKYEAFCSILPAFIGNPVYEWTHLELSRYFGIRLPVCAENAGEIWRKTERAMSDGSFSARSLIARSGVETAITTDDPADTLEYHSRLAAEHLPFGVFPCFRLDSILNIESPEFAAYLRRLENSSGGKISVHSYDDLLALLEARLSFFESRGCRAADVSFAGFPSLVEAGLSIACAAEHADSALSSAAEGRKPEAPDAAAYRFCLLRDLGILFAQNHMVFQMHTGVMRNCSSRLMAAYGRDAGADSVAGPANTDAARLLLDSIESGGRLPRTIVYTLDHSSYYPLATLLGDFQGCGRGQMQLGAAWWFMDHRAGILEQLETVAATGGLGLFNGMLTDSRSFLSYARHDYFRRILCSFIGAKVESGSYPDDRAALSILIEDICHRNAEKFFSGAEQQ